MGWRAAATFVEWGESVEIEEKKKEKSINKVGGILDILFLVSIPLG